MRTWLLSWNRAIQTQNTVETILRWRSIFKVGQVLQQSRVGPVWSPYCELQYALRYIPVRILPRVTCRSALLRLERHSQGWVVALGVLGPPGVAVRG